MDAILYSKLQKLNEVINGGKEIPTINLFNPDDEDILDNKYIDSSGNIQSYNGYIESGYIPCVKGDTFTFYNSDGYYPSSAECVYYDSDKTFLGGGTFLFPTSAIPTNKQYSNDISYFRIAIAKSKLTELMIVKNDTEIHDYVPYHIITQGLVGDVEDLQERVSTIENEENTYATKEEVNALGVQQIKDDIYGTLSINEFNKDDPDILSGGKYIDTDGTQQSASGYNESGYIPCEKGDKFTFSKNGEYFSSSRPFVFYNEQKQYVSGTTGYFPTVTIPNNSSIKYFRVPIINKELSVTMIVKNDTEIHDYVPYGLVGGALEDIEKNAEDIEEIQEIVNESGIAPWVGKSAICLGDSIMYNDAHSELNGYQYYMSQLGFASVVNSAVSGACVAYHSESHYEDICTTVDNITFTSYDLVVIAGGTNDYGFTTATPIGSLINSTTAGDFDKTTFIGALQYIITKILNSKDTIKIALFTPLKRSGFYNTNSEGKVLKDYADAIKEVAEYYSIPVLDYYAMSGINRKNVYTLTSDGLHPNNDGYLFISKSKLTSFINGL